MILTEYRFTKVKFPSQMTPSPGSPSQHGWWSVPACPDLSAEQSACQDFSLARECRGLPSRSSRPLVSVVPASAMIDGWDSCTQRPGRMLTNLTQSSSPPRYRAHLMMEELINSYLQINLDVGEIIAAVKKTECVWLSGSLGHFIKQGSSINIIQPLRLHSRGGRGEWPPQPGSGPMPGAIGETPAMVQPPWTVPIPDAQTLGPGPRDAITLPGALCVVSTPPCLLSPTLSQLKIHLLRVPTQATHHHSGALGCPLYQK